MDEIKLTGLKLYGHHGVLKEEKERGQEFLVDITLKTDLHPAGISDDLTKTVNYAEMAEYIAKIFDEEVFDLIEAVAEKLAGKLLIKYQTLSNVEITLHKPSAPIPLPFADVSVSVERGWHEAFVAVGSNLGDSKKIISEGVALLKESEDIVLIKEASLIKTAPYGVTDQPDFLNGMLKIKTLLTPEELLDRLNSVEALEKRERKVHWGPRTLDLDIIYYDDIVMDTERLTIPHRDMANREFVLKPLMETDPYKRHPVSGLTALEMLEKL